MLISLSFLVPNTGIICSNCASNLFDYLGVQTRNVLTNAIFNKILRRRAGDARVGLVLNLVNVDCRALEQGFQLLGQLLVIIPLLPTAIVLVSE